MSEHVYREKQRELAPTFPGKAESKENRRDVEKRTSGACCHGRAESVGETEKEKSS